LSAITGNQLMTRLLLVLAVTLPIVAFAVVSLAAQVPDFFNFCMSWGMSSGSALSVSPGGALHDGEWHLRDDRAGRAQADPNPGWNLSCFLSRNRGRRQTPPSVSGRCVRLAVPRIRSSCSRWVVRVDIASCSLLPVDLEGTKSSAGQLTRMEFVTCTSTSLRLRPGVSSTL
jgi:hypothetical protein